MPTFSSPRGLPSLLDEREITGRLDDHLAELLGRVLGDADGRAIMAHAMRRLARPHAAAHVATLVWSLVSSQTRAVRERRGSTAFERMPDLFRTL